jgi:predicted nucleic acid-binding protein
LIFLDTNVVSEVMRARPDPKVVEWLAVHAVDLVLSTVLIAEISFGISKIRPSERSPRLTQQLDQIRETYSGRIHSFDVEAAEIYGGIMGKAARAGRPIQFPDGMIAAITLRHQAELATRNVRDFGALGVKVVNPWD